MASFWDVACRVGDEIMRALDDLIEESESHFDTSQPRMLSGGGGGPQSPTPPSSSTGICTPRSSERLSPTFPSARGAASNAAAAAATSPLTSSPSQGQQQQQRRRRLRPRIPKIRLSELEHCRIQRFVDSALLQIAAVQLPCSDAVDELLRYYRGCGEITTTCASSPSLSHLLVRCEDGTELNGEEREFNEAIVRALPSIFLQLNWIHAGAEQVQVVRSGARVLVPWSVVYPLPRILHPAAHPLSPPALRRWSVWIGHQLLSDGVSMVLPGPVEEGRARDSRGVATRLESPTPGRRSKHQVMYSVGLPPSAPMAPPHPSHRTIGACITPTQWQLVLLQHGDAATMDDVRLLMDSTARRTSDATFRMRLEGCAAPCVLLIRTAMLDVVGAILPQLPPKGHRITGADAAAATASAAPSSGQLTFFTFTPTFRAMTINCNNPAAFFVINHESDGGVGVFAKCPQRGASAGAAAVDGETSGGTSCEHSPTNTPSRSSAGFCGASPISNSDHHADCGEEGCATGAAGDDCEFGIAVTLEPGFQRARIATVGSEHLPAPFSFNVATIDEVTDIAAVHIFSLAAPQEELRPSASAEEFVMVAADSEPRCGKEGADSPDGFVMV